MQTNNRCLANTWGMIFFLLVVLFFGGCSEEETGHETNENAIAFDCSASYSRATKTTVDEMQYFRVSAVWKKENGSYESFMNNQLVEKRDEKWMYSPVKYWPGSGSVSFFAHTPASSSGIELIHLDSASNQISIEYSVSPDYRQQEDFMVATSLNKMANPIYFDFKHALSSVDFQARSNEPGVTFRIKEIKLAKLYTKGIITGVESMGATTWLWYEQVDPDYYVVYQKYPFETQGDTYMDVGSLMVIPQEPVANFKILVSCDVITAGTTESKTAEFELDSDFEFVMGNKYKFLLDLTKQSFSPAQNRNMDAPQIKCYVVSEPQD